MFALFWPYSIEKNILFFKDEGFFGPIEYGLVSLTKNTNIHDFPTFLHNFDQIFPYFMHDQFSL